MHSAPIGIAAGSDGNLWFAQAGAASIGEVVLVGPTPIPAPAPTPAPPGGGPAPSITSGTGDPAPTPSASAGATNAAVGPTVVVGEEVVTAGKGKHQHLVGFQLDFNKPLDAASAQDPANYTVVQQKKQGHKLVSHPVAFRAVYDATDHSVQLVLKGRPKFARGGRIVVDPTSAAAIGAAADAQVASAAPTGTKSAIAIAILPRARGLG